MSLFLFSCIEQILQWMLELLALFLLSFSQRPPACLLACLPSWHYPCAWDIDDFFLSIVNNSSLSSGYITSLSSLHYQSLLGALSLLSKNPWYYSSVCSLQHQILLQNKKWMLSHSLKCIPCGFRLFKFLHPFVDCDVFFHLCNLICFCLSWKSYSLLSLSEELSAYFFEALPNPFMMTTSSSSMQLSASLLLDLSHGS